jgi:TolB-like protein/DNA-binding winged helix-turn-helix (wHTH) protein/Flp pilus assembly protein TadD
MKAEKNGLVESASAPRLIRFDRFLLDLHRGALRSGGQDIELRRKPFEVLKFLVQNAGRLVSKDEIVSAVWPDVFVTDDSVTQCIKELRRALGDDGDRLIRTVPRRGYRLDAEARPEVPPPSPGYDQPSRVDTILSGSLPAIRPRLWWVGAICAFTLILLGLWRSGHIGPNVVHPAHSGLEKPALAVLPFTGASNEDEYLADGITDDVINALGRFSSLTVMSRNAVAIYKGKSATPQQVGRDLAVKYVLEGKVHRLGERLRVTAELSDADRGQVLWSDRFDDAQHDLFAVQDRITTEVAGSLAIKVTQIEQQRAQAKPTDSLEAYDYVLRARRALALGANRSSNAEARALLKKAIKLDPHYASAYTGLGETYRLAVSMGWAESPESALREADGLAHKALTDNDADVRAHVLLGQIHIYYGRYEQALAELDRAATINPNDVDAVAGRGTVLVWSGRTQEGIAALEVARRIDPDLNVFNRFALALGYYLGEKYDSAIELLAQNLSDTPAASYNTALLAASYAQRGRSDDAARTAEMVRRADPGFNPEAFGTQLRQPDDRKRLREGLRKAGF